MSHWLELNSWISIYPSKIIFYGRNSPSRNCQPAHSYCCGSFRFRLETFWTSDDLKAKTKHQWNSNRYGWYTRCCTAYITPSKWEDMSSQYMIAFPECYPFLFTCIHLNTIIIFNLSLCLGDMSHFISIFTFVSSTRSIWHLVYLWYTCDLEDTTLQG